MKKLHFTSMLFAVAISATALVSCKEKPANTIETEATQEENPTQITFEKDLHDFGEIIQGEKVNTEFKFTNTGKNDLLISDAYGSCGCTVPEWPKEPIAPGQSGVIKVQFNSANRSGLFNKTVTVVANTQPNSNSKLIIKGTIIVPKD